MSEASDKFMKQLVYPTSDQVRESIQAHEKGPEAFKAWFLKNQAEYEAKHPKV